MGSALRAHTPAMPPVLRRGTLNLLALLGIAAVVYGSLAPFRMHPARTWCWQLAWHAPLASDAVANIIIYIPIGLLARLVLRRRESSWLREWLGAAFIAAGLSYGAEATQSLLIGRVASWTDVVFNVSGALLGIALAPRVQHLLRAQHAYLYTLLRTRPFAAAALTATIAIGFVALTPFDLQPTPHHLGRALQQVAADANPATWVNALHGTHRLDKLLCAGVYGVLALLLLLAAVEAGSRMSAAAGYAIRRSVTFATAVELLQLLTVSHAGSPFDLLLASACAVMGAAAGLLGCTAMPSLVRHPRTAFRWLVLAAGLAAMGRAGLALGQPGPALGRSMAAWLPLASGFHRPWSSLLAEYANHACQYGLICGLIVLYCRSIHRRPPAALLIGAALAAAVSAALLGGTWESAEPLLALMAAWIVLRFDRALFSTRTAGAATPG